LTQQVQRARLTGTQIRYVHRLAWESQFPNHDRPLTEVDPVSRRERYLMAEALGLHDGPVPEELAYRDRRRNNRFGLPAESG